MASLTGPRSAISTYKEAPLPGGHAGHGVAVDAHAVEGQALLRNVEPVPVGRRFRTRGHVQVAQSRAAKAAGVRRDLSGKVGDARQELGQRNRGHHRAEGNALPRHRDLARAQAQRLEGAVEVDVSALNARAEASHQRLDATLARVLKARVVAQSARIGAHRPGDHLLEIGQGDEARAPVGRDGSRMHAPQLLVVGNHEVAR